LISGVSARKNTFVAFSWAIVGGTVGQPELARRRVRSLAKLILPTVMKDRFSGVSTGFEFAQMPSRSEAQTAINEMDGKDLKGPIIDVNEARPRTNRRGRGGGGFGGRGRSKLRC